MSKRKENVLNKYPGLISYECTKKIIEQMEKNICKIKIEESLGTGFFCKIPFPTKEKMLPVLITCHHVIKDSLDKKKDYFYIDIKEEYDTKKIELKERMYYLNVPHDIAIIEIKENDKIKNFLELDDIIINDIIYNKNKNKEFIDKTIYIIQYPESELSVSYGLLTDICKDENKNNFNHLCSTRGGSSGSPILNKKNKVIGIHSSWEKESDCNLGNFLNDSIKEFITKYIHNSKNEKSKIVYKNIDLKNDKNIKLDNNINKININNNIINVMDNNHDKSNQNINKNEKNIFELKKENFLNEFNKKYNLNIENTKIDKLILNSKEISNIKLEDLCKIEFTEIKELYLNQNYISEIKPLEFIKLEKIEILNLSSNKISDISVLQKVNFNKLKILDLSRNIISDINILDKVNFKELKDLYLNNNDISNINVLSKIKFKKLETLDLSSNKIDRTENSSIIQKCKCQINNFIILNNILFK